MAGSAVRWSVGVAGIVLLGGLVAWFASQERERPAAALPGGSREMAVGEESGELDLPVDREAEDTVGERTQVAIGDEVVESRPSGSVEPAEKPELPPDDWRHCFGDPDPVAVRECIRASLGGRILGPEELAEMVCHGAPPDAASRLLMGVVAAEWSPGELAGNAAVFQGLCDGAPNFWADFVRDRLVHDPDFAEPFTQSLSPELLSSAPGTALVGMAAELARWGDVRARALVEAVAAGDGAPSDVQTALALARAASWQPTPRHRIELLRSAMESKRFAGGVASGRELAALLLRPELVGTDAEAVVELVLSALSNPTLAAGAADAVA
ncbi:MAG TPA: hypothetical protein ENJ09_08350, partial [Planctomycetes bacterium]|nr:hypothetical protein [Planctomycetota bacterium]